MPIPFLIPIIIVGVSTVAGLFTVAAYWDDLIIFFKGKNIAILGSIETGKSTMHTYLREGEVIVTHNSTKKVNVSKNRFKLGELEINIKEGIDISGQRDYMSDWKNVFKTSDICFYMFDTYKIYNNDLDYIEKIYFHLTHINNWKEELNINPKIIMIGGFSDKIPEFNQLNESNVQEFEEKIRVKIKPAFLQGSISPSNIFIGSLATKVSIEKLLRDVLIRISQD
ncbi:hypothetical protein [Rhodonellum sp.]|uniref:hypothetical protein n=1 Tax=Rhodonellum sp. TaxID=2231180 RepID=UPI00271C607D|nr:hypothetical protein [Rhodonellum sp.]MDO9552942.1 hypothetical protein [Rhodonellum sp.]